MADPYLISKQRSLVVNAARALDKDKMMRIVEKIGVGPIQFRYAGGEWERLGAVEHKLFVGSMNWHTTEKEIEEELCHNYARMPSESKLELHIYSIVQTYCLQQSYESEFPLNGLSASQVNSMAIVHMKSLDARELDDHCEKLSRMDDALTNNIEQVVSRQFYLLHGPLCGFCGPTNGSLPGLAALPSSISQQSFNASLSPLPSVGQQISPLQKTLHRHRHNNWGSCRFLILLFDLLCRNKDGWVKNLGESGWSYKLEFRFQEKP